MAKKRFLIEVEEGNTMCYKCPLVNTEGWRDCWITNLVQCSKYNLTTMKVKELEESQ